MSDETTQDSKSQTIAQGKEDWTGRVVLVIFDQTIAVQNATEFYILPVLSYASNPVNGRYAVYQVSV